MRMTVPIAAALMLINVAAYPTPGVTHRGERHQAGSSVWHFVKVALERFPRSVIMRDFCNERDAAGECWRSVRSTGRVWAGDVNGDHIDELILFPGVQWAGSAGRNYYLYQRQGKVWQSIAAGGDDDGWFTDRPRFDILPISRNGYRDLRIDVNECLKWSDGKYVAYDPADYARLVPSWFDQTDPHQAEIFWTIRQFEAKQLLFEPQWFPISPIFFSNSLEHEVNRQGQLGLLKEWHDDGDFPRLVSAVMDDKAENIRWVSLMRAGVWGVRGNQAFLLVPRTSYLGVCQLAIKGDWLLGYESCVAEDKESEPGVRYNRRTHELQISVPD